MIIFNKLTTHSQAMGGETGPRHRGLNKIGHQILYFAYSFSTSHQAHVELVEKKLSLICSNETVKVLVRFSKLHTFIFAIGQDMLLAASQRTGFMVATETF